VSLWGWFGVGAGVVEARRGGRLVLNVSLDKSPHTEFINEVKEQTVENYRP